MPAPSQRTAPLPARNGIAPSFLQLPTRDWPDLLHFLIARFPHIAPEIWQQRLAAGQVFDHLGQPHSLHSSYPANRRIWYYREVAIEPPVPFEATVLYQDERLVVAERIILVIVFQLRHRTVGAADQYVGHHQVGTDAARRPR